MHGNGIAEVSQNQILGKKKGTKPRWQLYQKATIMLLHKLRTETISSRNYRITGFQMSVGEKVCNIVPYKQKNISQVHNSKIVKMGKKK